MLINDDIVRLFQDVFLLSMILSSIIGKNPKHNRWYLRELEHRIIGKIRSILHLSLVTGVDPVELGLPKIHSGGL